MRTLLLTTAGVVALGSSAQAATFLIDDFDQDQAVFDQPSLGQVDSSTQTPAGNLGGSRMLTVDANVPADAVLGASVIIENGAVNFNNDNGVASDVELVYENFGTLDLTRGGLGIGFIYSDVNTDNGFNFDVVATDIGGGVSSFNTIVPGEITGVDIFGAFDEFTGGADLTQIVKLEFDVASNDEEDASLDSIAINVIPLPASGLLLVGALGGAAAFARKRQRA